jgi:hypothetical protein
VRKLHRNMVKMPRQVRVPSWGTTHTVQQAVWSVPKCFQILSITFLRDNTI